MKSYSDAVPDTNKVAEVEAKLTKQIADLQLAQAQVIASMKAEQDKINVVSNKTHNITIITIVLMTVMDIIRFGFLG